MGFRQAAVLCSICFFLGILFINFNVDHRILFFVRTEADVEAGYAYYTTFFRAPLAVKALIHTLIGVGILSLILNLTNWSDAYIWFEVTSVVFYVAAIIMYISVSIPAVKTVVNPVPDEDTAADREEALGVLGAANILIALLFVGILVLQAGQEYARHVEATELKRIQREEQAAKEAAAGGESKKDQ